MPKKKKIYTETLYTYIQPVNRRFVETQAKKNAVSHSNLIDTMITRYRKTGIPKKYFDKAA